MTNIADTLKACHALVWQYRAELEPYWPTPTTEDALLFAFTELGEAVDAYLRTKPQYARNNAKELDVLDELADCALMLLTAMGDDYVPVEGMSIPLNSFIWYTSLLTDLLQDAVIDRLDYADMAYAVVCIATHPGMDLPARLQARLEAIKAKRMPQEVAA